MVQVYHSFCYHVTSLVIQFRLCITEIVTCLGQMRTYRIIRQAIALRGREIQEVAGAVGVSRAHLSRYLNGRSPNFGQALVDKLFEELGLRVVMEMDDVDELLPGSEEASDE